MVKKARIVLWMLLCMVSLSGVLAAQPRPQPTADSTPTKRVPLSGAYSIQIPVGWESQDQNDGTYVFGPNQELLILLDPLRIPDIVDIPDDALPAERVDALVEAIYGELFYDPADHVSEVIGGMRASLVYYIAGENNEFEGKLGVARLPDDTFAYFDYMTLEGELDSDENTAVLDEIMASLAATAVPTTASGAACLVSVATAQTAALRVGPGINRSSVAYLAPGIDFTVTGAFTADDGSEWFQLDKAEAAPASAASEIWVARLDVDETGDCDAVQAANAPPIVPILSAPPASSGGDGGSSGEPAPVPGAVPRAGLWTITFQANGNASCEGFENIVVPTGELFSNMPASNVEQTNVTVTNGGANMSFRGVPFTAAGNGYFGTYPDGTNTQFYITSVTETTMTGQMVGNITIDGTPCSGTVLFSMRRG